MFVQPILASEQAYHDHNSGGNHVENEYNKASGSPDAFFFVESPTTPSQSQFQPQVQSPAQAYAQSYVETHPNRYEDRQPLTSDSSRTPPSPIAKYVPGQRRSIQRPSQINHNTPMLKRTSNAHSTGHNSNQNASTANPNNTPTNDKRTQSLTALPPQTLIHLLQIKEEERKRAKNLLKNALVQLEVEVQRGEVLSGRVRELEENAEREKVEKEKGGGLDVDALKEMLAEQRGRVSGGAEVEALKLKLSNTERELHRIKEDYRALQIERDDSDRALVRARTLAREMKEKAILIQAREQGRMEGFEEGLKQGRVLSEGSSLEASGSARRSGERFTNHKSSSRRDRNPASADAGPSQASLEAEAARATLRLAERENERVQLQLKAVERELNAEREKMKDVEKEKGQLEKVVREERRRRDDREKEQERERVKEREAREAKEKEMREALKKEVEERDRVKRQMEREKEKEVEERERVKRQMEREKEKIREEMAKEKEKAREQMEKEKQDMEKKLAEANKDKEKVEKQLKKEKEKANPLPYLAMARPPSSSGRVPEVSRTSSSESRQQHRRSSLDSYTSQASTIPFDMLQLPNGDRDRGGDLSVIYEDASPSATNSASGSAAPPPAWLTNPPVDFGKTRNDDRATPDLRLPQESTSTYGSGSYPPYNPQNRNQPDYLAPSDNNVQSSRRSTSSTGSYEIVIVPPSRPASVIGGGDADANDTHNAHNTYHPHNYDNPDDPQFLSPNHRPIQLPQTQTRAESPSVAPIPPRHGTPYPRGDTSGIPSRSSSPAGFMGAIDVNGGFPPGFVPQSITDARGRSTPVGGGFIPPASGGGGRPGTPNNQWSNPVIPPASSSGPAPIYGNPITLERDKKREEAAGYPATTASRPQSPAGADWSAPLTAVHHPPIFPMTGHQQPFQHLPPAHKPSFEYTRPVIPGQTSSLGADNSSSGGGGGSAWGATQRPGGGGGMTPGPGSQNLSPVIPAQTLAGVWSGGTPNRPSSGFGAGGMTPGSRNQNLPPVIPNSSLGGSGGAWGTSSRLPGSFGAGGMTPGSRNQDLPPVIPNSTMGGGSGVWTPNRSAGGFGGGGMTPGPRNQDLSPVIPNSTLGAGSGAWTPSRGGATPGARNQDLPPFIPNPTLWGTPSPSRPPGSFGGTTPGPRNQDLPPVIPNPTLSGGAWTPSRATGSFGAAAATPGPRNQGLPSGGGSNGSPYQPSFSIYGPPPTNGGRSSPFLAARSSSPYPNEGDGEDVDREDDDPITVQNTKLNAANLSMDVGSSMGVGGGRGGKGGKKGKKKR